MSAGWAARYICARCPVSSVFQFLQGPRQEDHILYASHTVWESQEAFIGWTQSEQFRIAHATAGTRKPLMSGPPVFEGFEVLQNIEN